MDIFDPVVLYSLVMLTMSFAIIVMAFILAGIHVPEYHYLDSFRRAKRYLAISYFIMGVINLVTFFYHNNALDHSFLSVKTVILASYQALLFTSSILVLMHPYFVSRKFVISNLGLATLLGIILFFAFFKSRNLFFPVLLYIAFAAYLMQLAYFTYLFRKTYKICLRKLEAYYDEDSEYRLRWVRYSFYSALVIGAIALLSLFVNMYFYSLCGVIYIVFYAYMVRRFYNYQIDSKHIISGAIKNIESDDDSNSHKEAFSEEKCAIFEKSLTEWVEEKKYADKDASVQEIANQLGVNYNFLRHYFSTYVGTDFRSWRLGLRIQEAKSIMENHPEIPTNQICEMVGYGDRSNFHKQFLKDFGMTPAEFKQSFLPSK